MTTENTPPPATKPEETSNTSTDTTDGKFVPKETYDKLFSEHRNWREKAKATDAELQAIKMAQMEKDNNLKGVNEALLKRLQEKEDEIKRRDEQETRAIKLTKVKQEWNKLGLKDAEPVEAMLDLVKLDAVKYDPELKVVLGAEEEAKRIFEKFQPMFKGLGAKPNHDAPQGAPADVSIDSYRRMLADGSFKKMTPVQQREYEQKLYSASGLTLKK